MNQNINKDLLIISGIKVNMDIKKESNAKLNRESDTSDYNHKLT